MLQLGVSVGEGNSAYPTAQSSPIFWDLPQDWDWTLHAGRLGLGEPLNTLPHKKKCAFLSEQRDPGSEAMQDAACMCKLFPSENN